MAYYLQMDGTKDLLLTPSLTFTKVEIDLYVENAIGKAQTYFDARSNNLLAYLSRDVNNLEIWLILVLNVAVNGVAKLPSNNIIPAKSRQIVTVTMLLPATDSVTIFARKNKTEHVKGRIYGIKFYNNNTMVANYDMQTRTVQDQSGNGRHATTEGGTWASDTPSIVDAGDLTAFSQTSGATEGKRVATAQLSNSSNSNVSLFANKIVKGEVIGSATGNGTLATDKTVRGEATGTAETNSISIANKISISAAASIGQTNATGTAIKMIVANAIGESNSEVSVIPNRVINGSATVDVDVSGESAAIRVIKGETIGKVDTHAIYLTDAIVEGRAYSSAVTEAIGEAKTLFKGESIGEAISNGTTAAEIHYYAKVIKGELLTIRKQSGELKTIRKVTSEVIL